MGASSRVPDAGREVDVVGVLAAHGTMSYSSSTSASGGTDVEAVASGGIRGSLDFDLRLAIPLPARRRM